MSGATRATLDPTLMSSRFENWHQPWCVQHGIGSHRSLPEELERIGVSRVLLMTTGSLVREESVLAGVNDLLGSRLVATFGECRQHAPMRTVLAAAELARRHSADCVVALGGSSVSDSAKGVALTVAEQITEPEQYEEYRVGYRPGEPVVMTPAQGTLPPVIALPTTLSGGEFSGAFSLQHPGDGDKRAFLHDGLVPRLIVLDPLLARATSAKLWAATGMKSLGGAIETVYSPYSHPMVAALALDAVRRFVTNLRAGAEGDADARLQCFLASFIAHVGTSTNSLGGLSASLRHELAPVAGVSHAESTAVLLPHVLRFNLPAVPSLVAGLVWALGVESAGIDDPIEAIVACVGQLISDHGLPSTLHDLGVSPGVFTTVAQRAGDDFSGAGNPRPFDEHDVLSILNAAL